MLRSYRPREAYKVPAEMRENQWRWTGLLSIIWDF